MNEHRQGLDVAQVFGVLLERWKTVLTITLLACMAAYGYVTFMAKEVFEATALVTYQVPDRANNPTNGALPSSGITREDIGTLVANATSQQVLDAAAAELGTDASELRRTVRVQAHGDASVVAFIARGGDASETAEQANALARAFVADRQALAKQSLDRLVKLRQQDLVAARKIKQNPDDPDPTLKNAAQQELNEAKSRRALWVGALSLSNAAQAPELAVWPRKTLTMFAALVIGMGIGSGVALLTARVDNRLRDDEFDQMPAPVIARVPISPRAPKNTPLGPAMAEPVVADSFAALGSRVMHDRHGDGAHVILVTSARSGEGKSSVAANLASALALGGRRVVLVDADMRRPTQDQVFPTLQSRPGLSQVLTRGAELEAALTLVAPNLAAIGSGPRHNNASVLLASVALRQMIERLEQISEVIVIDAPPVLAVNDALAVAPAANQVLLVARVNASDMHEVNEAHQRLLGAAQTPQSMVLVGTERPEGYGYDQELRATGRAAMPAAAPQAAVAGRVEGGQAASAPQQAQAQQQEPPRQAPAQQVAQVQAPAPAQVQPQPPAAQAHPLQQQRPPAQQPPSAPMLPSINQVQMPPAAAGQPPLPPARPDGAVA